MTVQERSLAGTSKLRSICEMRLIPQELPLSDVIYGKVVEKIGSVLEVIGIACAVLGMILAMLDVHALLGVTIMLNGILVFVVGAVCRTFRDTN